MNRTEALAFLGLAENAVPEAVQKKFAEKYNYFQVLLTNAPTERLHHIYQENIETLLLIHQLLPELSDQQHAPAHVPDPAPHQAGQLSAPLGWLIRHTENLPPLSFPLEVGENLIGRLQISDKSCITLPDDSFISRVHALLTVIKTPDAYTFALRDAGYPGISEKSSKNGTYLNGHPQRLEPEQSVSLIDGDTIQIGQTKLILRVNRALQLGQVLEEIINTGYVSTIIIKL